jgi:glutamate dehydrogenase (NADP+)
MCLPEILESGPAKSVFFSVNTSDLENRFTGILTGKGLSFGGSWCAKKPPDTVVSIFVKTCSNALEIHLMENQWSSVDREMSHLYTVEKAIELGAKVLTVSDSSGFIHDPDGIDQEKLQVLKEIKEVQRKRVFCLFGKISQSSISRRRTPVDVPCDVAFPCATQNELNEEEARTLVG